jgi:hypothetical protein
MPERVREPRGMGNVSCSKPLPRNVVKTEKTLFAVLTVRFGVRNSVKMSYSFIVTSTVIP